MTQRFVTAGAAMFTIAMSSSAFAWNAAGHQTVAQLAEQLISGSRAATQVRAILGPSVTLSDAAVWADCVKGVNENHDFEYENAGRFPECAPFESAGEREAMIDYVRRNAHSCVIKPGEETCHRQYHYADIDIAAGRYSANLPGARSDDVVQALGAAQAVLEGKPSPAPFHIQGRREALMLLVHFVGDIYQPLHVGALYLDATGRAVHPGAPTIDPATSTRGGNQVLLDDENLHHRWDDMPYGWTTREAVAALLGEARAVPSTAGDRPAWPTAWASESVVEAKEAFGGVAAGAKSGAVWPAQLPADYGPRMDAIKQRRLASAGARLAALLRSVWP